MEVTEFLERIEAPVVVAWGFGLLIDVSVFLYCGSKGVAQLLGLKDYRPLVGPMAVIWVIMTVHAYENLFQVLRLFQPDVIAPYIAAIFLVPYVFLWGAYTIRSLLGKVEGQKGGV